jgi:hypothetical protein
MAARSVTRMMPSIGCWGTWFRGLELGDEESRESGVGTDAQHAAAWLCHASGCGALVMSWIIAGERQRPG